MDARHRFQTTESRKQPGLHTVGVRRSGDGTLATGAFDVDRLSRDIYQGALKLLSETEAQDVAESVAQSLQSRHPLILKPLTKAEARARPELEAWIGDWDILLTVEQRLRQRKARLAHVLYALSVRGRSDREGRQGWPDAPSFLTWLYDQRNYPDLRLPIPPVCRVGTDAWWPAVDAPDPRDVIKRNGRSRPFLRLQFEASVRKALLGRPQPEIHARLIAEWVLWGLAGQQAVHTSQLSVGVLDCLRRVDDIAYLRWASIAKQFTTVTQVRDEAHSLVTHPSTRLRFDVSARPQRPDGSRSSSAQ